jgi:methionyl-tRNA formyltransferase
LYDGAKEFGITVHHMKPKVDSGEIIMVKRFPVSENETVWTLSQKCYAYIFTAFCELLPLFKEGDGFRGMSNEIWKRKPYTRKELDALCEITEDMSDDEVRRRVRATTYPNMPGAYIKKGGHKFEFSA